MSTIVIAPPTIDLGHEVVIEVQGKHGIASVPTQSEIKIIEKSIIHWLYSMWPEIDQRVYTLFQVNCLRREPISSPQLVKIKGRVDTNPNALEVAVHSGGVQTREGYLVFDTPEIRSFVWETVFHETVKFIQSGAEAAAEPIVPDPKKGQWAKQKSTIYRNREHFFYRGSNREVQMKLCAEFAPVMNGEVITLEQIRKVSSIFFKADLTSDLEFRYWLGILLNENLFVARRDVEETDADNEFIRTTRFERLLAEHNDSVEQKKVEQQRLFRQSADREIESSNQKILRLERELKEEQERNKELIDKRKTLD
jgi:hypothetical protein